MVSLSSVIKKIIWLCMLPLFLFAIGLAGHQVNVIKHQQVEQAEVLADNFTLKIDNSLRARINALNMLAVSPLVDDLSKWNELYQQAEGFNKSFGSHVVITDGGSSPQLLLDTRVPFGAALPKVKKPNGRLAGPVAMQTGKPAVSDLFLGPVAQKPLLGVAVPAVREGKAKYAILTTIEKEFFQQIVDHFTLPPDWHIALRDAQGDVIASRPQTFAESHAAICTANSQVSGWTVTVGIPPNSYWSPLVNTGIALGAALFSVTLAGVLGGQWTGRRLGQAIASLAQTPAPEVPPSDIVEIAAVRQLLDDDASIRAATEQTLRDSREALLQSETRFRTLAEFAPVGIAITDPKENIVFLNRHFTELFGYTAEDLPNIRQWWRLAYPDEQLRERVRQIWTSTMENAGRSQLPTEPTEYPVTCRDGSIKHIEFRKRSGGDLNFITMTDVTRRKEAEDALKRSHERYQAFVARSHEAIYCTEFDQPIDVSLPVEEQIDAIYANAYMGECNQAMASMYGVDSPEDFVGARMLTAHGGDANPVNRDVFRQFIESGYSKNNSVTEEILADGSVRHFQTNDVGIIDDGKLQRIWGTQLDVTEKTAAERSLKESKELLNAILNAIPVRVFWKDRSLRFLGCNAAFAVDAGFECVEEVVGKNDFDLPWKDYAEQYRADDLAVIEGGTAKLMYEEQQTTPAQETGYLLTSKLPLKDGNGETIGVLGSYLDITERKQAEEERKQLQSQLMQAQKMEAIGALAGGIAHDFNNILGAVMGYAEMVKDGVVPGSETDQDIDRVLQAGHRAAELVKQILAFSRQGATERVPLEPALMIKEAMKLLRPTLPATISITQKLAADRAIIADPTQFHQVLINLCTNAYHAMEETGGRLHIELVDCVLSSQDVQQRHHVAPGNFVKLSVSDTGPGIPPEIRNKIFEPYFTTKSVGKGTGMGLAITHGILAASGGFIDCESVVGQGTVFHVYFPAIEHMPEKLENAPSDVVCQGQERILFVDDEVILADMGQAMLERLGYQVTTFTSSEMALAAFQRNPHQFDAVVTDQTMPEMTGAEFSAAALQIRPDIPIILCTGYSNLIDEEQARQLGIRGYLRKPLTRQKLAALLRKTLDEQTVAIP
jgi:PAS domain S-box-containing protein